MSQRVIIENRSQYDLDEVFREAALLADKDHGDGWDLFSAFLAGATLGYEGGLMVSIFQNKRSTRLVFHQNDGVDHQEKAS